jgi:peroxiredoxin (alkyl hydroperoxide reductase subunit C)
MSILVGRAAPDFTAAAVLGNGEIVGDLNFNEARAGKYAWVVFYPLDFTFVCPSELIALDHRVAALKNLGCEVFTVSIDSQFTHNAWRNTAINDGGIGPVGYTMVADTTQAICQAYGVQVEGAGVAYRGSFLIDKAGNVRHQVVNDLPLGRNLDEMIRLTEALQFHEEHGEVCPANWKSGDAGMTASPAGVASYLSDNADKL